MNAITHTPGELKACAHCDAAAPQVYASLHHVHCNVCGAVAPKAAWNTRAVDTELLEVLKAAKVREAELVDALDGIYIYANDTLSGRADGPDDRKWQRDGIVEIRNRARKFATAQSAIDARAAITKATGHG